jgi:hypothetical protein
LVAKKGSNIDKESSNNIMLGNKTLEGFHGNPEIQKITTVLESLQSPTQQNHKPLIFESSNEYEQSHQQDFCIHQKYKLTEDKLGHHTVNILQLQYPKVNHLA